MATRNERDLKATQQKMTEVAAEIDAIWKKGETEDRHATEDERLDVESKLHTIEKELKPRITELEKAIETEKDIKRISNTLGAGESTVSDVRVTPGGEPVDRLVKSIGRQFIENPTFKSVHDKYKSGSRERFSTGSIELNLKGTLLEGAGSPGAGTGGGFVPVPQVIPGVVETLFQPLRIAELILSGQAQTNSVRYVVEGTATSGAAGVAEGGAKPQSTLALSTKDMPVTKMATSLKVSDEMLEDAAQVESYINGRLQLFVMIEEERQIARGAGSGSNELQGIIGTSGVNVYARGTVDNNAVALFKAMNGQRGSAFLEPDWIAINPANYQALRLLTDTAGQFFGGGPFQGPYGNGSNLAASGQVTGAQDTIWGKPTIVTTAVGAGTALIGTRAAAQLWSRGALSVEAANQNEDDFLHNLVAIRAEKREALTVYRPAAFTVVSGLS